MYYYLVAVYFAVLLLVTSTIFFLCAFVLRITTWWFDRRLAILHIASSIWASCYTWLCPLWKVVITGRENVDRKKAYVMVSNHQSMLDILIIYRTFLHFKWVAKSSLYKVPVIGWNLWFNRHVGLDRNNPKSQRKMLLQCSEHLKNGSSLMIFPEGTRSRNGELISFKEGAFIIAKKEKTDIVPMVIDNSYKALPEKGIIPKWKQTVYLRILPPIAYETFKDMGIRQLTEHVRTIIAEELVRMRGEGRN